MSKATKIEETHQRAVTKQTELDELICNIMRSKSSLLDSSIGYSNKASGREQYTSWGIATSGVSIFNGISGEGVDPFYPVEYNG